MHGGLKLARPRRHRRWPAAVAGLLLLVLAGPRLAAAGPAALTRLNALVGNRLVAGYTAELTALQAENAALHRQLAQAESALAENEALRTLLDSARAPAGNWQPARVVARWPDGVTLAIAAPQGAAVLDPQGRYAGRVTDSSGDTCRVAFAGTENDPCAGLSGSFAGLLAVQGGWWLTGLPADCGLAAGSVVTTPGGYWLGTLDSAPQADRDGLTARARLTDTAAQDSTLFFVKI